MGYGRGLAVCMCRLTLRNLKFLECLETARIQRPFIDLVRKPPEGKSYCDVTLANVTPVTDHVPSDSNSSGAQVLNSYLPNGSPKDRGETASVCACQRSRISMESIL